VLLQDTNASNYRTASIFREMMEAAGFFETPAPHYNTTLRHNPEVPDRNPHRCENLKYR
jgi:hypothetical protein